METQVARLRRVVAVALGLLLSFPQITFAAEESGRLATSTFNQLWQDAVISIECEGCKPPESQGPKKDDRDKEPFPIGTGFLFGTPLNHVLLVTVGHVLDLPKREPPPRLGYRLTAGVDPNRVIWDADLEATGFGSWHISKSADVACRFFAAQDVRLVVIAHTDHLRQVQLAMGAQLLVLGFPLGRRSAKYARPIARKGIVARVDDEGILADVFIFPGNSGGPVIYTPPIKVGVGLHSPLVPSEKLIGLARGFVPYSDVAISLQTGKPRVVFEENSGLAEVVPVDRLLELIETAPVRAQDRALPPYVVEPPSNPPR